MPTVTGGNVALSAIAMGERVRLLVLLHTPILSRPSAEWASIRSNVGRVLVMRSRADLVMLADGLRTGSALHPAQSQLAHREVLPHWRDGDAWFSHNLFVSHDNWTKYALAGEVRFEHGIAEGPQRPV